ncbi:unnamed protein product [Victoria cruziana]
MANFSFTGTGRGGGGRGVRRKESLQLTHSPAPRGPISRLVGRLQRYIFREDDDTLPWTEPSDIASCEREASNGIEGSTKLCFALVHSRQRKDVQRGMSILAADLDSSSSLLQKMEKLYLLAVGYFRTGDETHCWLLLQEIVKDLDEVPELEEEDTASMSLLSALMQSGLQENVGIGIALLADALKDCSSRLKRTRVLCLLALEYRRQGRYSKSQYFIEQASKELPLLKKVFHLEDVAYCRMMKGNQIIMGFAVIASILFAGGCFLLGIKKFSRLDRRGK